MLLTGTHELDLGSVRRNMPDPIPMAVLGCLAVDRNWQGGGIGGALLQDAVLRTLLAAAIMGIRGILVYAIFDEAKVFHERHGFKGLREQSDCQRRRKSRPLGGAKAGHLAALAGNVGRA